MSPYRQLAVIPDDLPQRYVVCKNCKFFRDHRWCVAGHVDSVTGISANTITACADRNGSNNCSLYRRPWWKFWLPR